MHIEIKRVISAVTAITTAIGMSNLYLIGSFNAHSSDNTLTDRLAAPCDASVSYAVPNFMDFIGPDVDDANDIAPMAPYGTIRENINILGNETVLPETFDLLSAGRVSSIKNQASYETCWTFAASASGETSLIDAIPNINLSEMHTAFFPYFGDEGMYFEGKEKAENNGFLPFNELMNTGGMTYSITNLWSQWKGPVDEDKLSYVDINLFYTPEYAERYYRMADYHLENAYMFDLNEDGTNRDAVINLIKQFLYKGNGVDASFFTKGYDEATNAAYTYYKHSLSNHSVTIVGWDDNYTAKNFEGNTGAWLVKNSWGTSFGDSGYFHIAYADTTIGSFTVYDLGENTNYTTNYQHDSFMPTQAMAAGNDASVNKPSYMANIFAAEETQQIQSISTYILNPDTDYEITVYTDLKDMSDPTSGTASAVTKGTSQLTGYLTLELDENVIVDKGESFAVVVSLYCENSEYVLPVESCVILEKDGEIVEDVFGNFTTYEQICRFTDKNQSFYSENGNDWTDVTSANYLYTEDEKKAYFDSLAKAYRMHVIMGTISKEDAAKVQEYSENSQIKIVMGNLSLKAFGNPVNTVDFSHIEGEVCSDEKVSLSVKDNSDIYVSVNGGEYALYKEPFEITEETVITATTDNITFTEKKYTPAKADLNGLMYSFLTSDEESHNAYDAEKMPDGSYEIVLGGIEEGIAFIPNAGAEVCINGKPVESHKLTEFYELHSGKNKFTFELKQENKLDNTITVTVSCGLVTFDAVNETVRLNDVSVLRSFYGQSIADGDSVSDYAGQELIATYKGNEYYIKVPERAELPYLEVDYLNETINFFPNEIADSVVYSIGENTSDADYIPAESRFIDGQHITSGMIMNKAFRIIPGETITLKIKPSEGKFASIPQTFKLDQIPDVPDDEPEYTVHDEYYELKHDFNLEYGVVNEPLTDEELESQAEMFGYNTEDFAQIMMKRHGVSDVDTLRKVMAVEWDAAFRIERKENQNTEIAVRSYCLDNSFASRMKFSELICGIKGDADGNGSVDSSDASAVLAYYAATSTGDTPDMTALQLYCFDFNEDNCIDASDASEILNYYAMISTGQFPPDDKA